MIKCFWFDFGMHWEFKRHLWFVDDTFVLGLWFSSGTCNLQNCYNWSERDSFRNNSEFKIETSTDVSLKCLVNPGFLYWGLFANFHNLTAFKLQFLFMQFVIFSVLKYCAEKRCQRNQSNSSPFLMKNYLLSQSKLPYQTKLFNDELSYFTTVKRFRYHLLIIDGLNCNISPFSLHGRLQLMSISKKMSISVSCFDYIRMLFLWLKWSNFTNHFSSIPFNFILYDITQYDKHS